MSALEEIQTAIEKLTEFSTYGIENADDDYEVTLHRTIDAQLAILTAAKVDEYECAEEWERIGKPHLRGPAKIVPINMAALKLARAINGTA